MLRPELGGGPIVARDAPGTPSLGCSANPFDNGFAFGFADDLSGERIAADRHFRNGEFAGAIVPLNAAQVSNVARFMRVMGADFNGQQAITLLEKAAEFPNSAKAERRINVRLAIADIRDAIQRLRPAQLHISDARPMFKDAIDVLKKNNGGVTANIDRIEDALAIVQDARDAMVIRDDSDD